MLSRLRYISLRQPSDILKAKSGSKLALLSTDYCTALAQSS